MQDSLCAGDRGKAISGTIVYAFVCGFYVGVAAIMADQKSGLGCAIAAIAVALSALACANFARDIT